MVQVQKEALHLGTLKLISIKKFRVKIMKFTLLRTSLQLLQRYNQNNQELIKKQSLLTCLTQIFCGFLFKRVLQFSFESIKIFNIQQLSNRIVKVNSRSNEVKQSKSFFQQREFDLLQWIYDFLYIYGPVDERKVFLNIVFIKDRYQHVSYLAFNYQNISYNDV
ncbi:unnamed protein product [Paramecium pentaurelia]|uniref:Uncharacterized protein n=1 Tax=Paramecium pentaurelia TaxID=43138 RepID=A0A8S1TU29_9CILI|nr:unnamed protein product [Paramecium pentaurelia]